MTTIDDMLAEAEMISVGTVPIHPGVLDYQDAQGKVILFVRDNDEGRSIYMGVEIYGEISRLYECRWDDWVPVITKMAGDVTMHNHDDVFNQLLGGK